MLHTSISPVSPPFSCAQNGISLLKEIFFLPQRRKFLAAKKFSDGWKAAENGASEAVFRPDGTSRRTKSG